MADPLSIAAGVAGVVSAGFAISTSLYDVIATFKDAPQELNVIASEIQWTSTMLRSVCELIDEHRSLYKTQLIDMLKDLRWRFKLIQDDITKCIKPGRKSIHSRIRYLFVSKRITGLVAKLEGVKHSMNVTLSIAQLAERHRQVRWPRLDCRLKTDFQLQRQDSFGGSYNRTDPPSTRSHVQHFQFSAGCPTTHERSPAASITCSSATASPIRRKAGSNGNLDVVDAVGTGDPRPRPKPVENVELSETRFLSGQVDTRALDEFNMEWQPMINDDKYTILVKNNKKPLDEFEVDMVTGTSVVMRATAMPDWDIMKTPFMSMRPSVLANRLLEDWTNVKVEELQDGVDGDGDGDGGVRIKEPQPGVEDDPIEESSDEFSEYDWEQDYEEQPHQQTANHDFSSGRQMPFSRPFRSKTPPRRSTYNERDIFYEPRYPAQVPPSRPYFDQPRRHVGYRMDARDGFTANNFSSYSPYVPPAKDPEPNPKATSIEEQRRTTMPADGIRATNIPPAEDRTNKGQWPRIRVGNFDASRTSSAETESQRRQRPRSESPGDVQFYPGRRGSPAGRRKTSRPNTLNATEHRRAQSESPEILQEHSERRLSQAKLRMQAWVDDLAEQERRATEKFHDEIDDRWNELREQMTNTEDPLGSPARGRQTTVTHSKGPFGERVTRREVYSDDGKDFSRTVEVTKDPPPGWISDWVSDSNDIYKTKHRQHDELRGSRDVVVVERKIEFDGGSRPDKKAFPSGKSPIRIKERSPNIIIREPSVERGMRNGSPRKSSPKAEDSDQVADKRSRPGADLAASSSRNYRAATVSSEPEDGFEEYRTVEVTGRDTMIASQGEEKLGTGKETTPTRDGPASVHSLRNDDLDNSPGINTQPKRNSQASKTSSTGIRVDKLIDGHMSLDSSTLERIVQLARNGAVAEHRLKESKERTQEKKSRGEHELKGPAPSGRFPSNQRRQIQGSDAQKPSDGNTARDNMAVSIERFLSQPEDQSMSLSKRPAQQLTAQIEPEVDMSSETAESVGSGSHHETPPSFVTEPPSPESQHRHVPCSTPWQGVVHPVRPHIVPIYIRGNELGQTWFAGHDPVYIVQFSQDYLRKCGSSCCPSGLHGQSKQYLLISTDWISPETLEQHGIRYKVAWQSYLYLDPSMEYDDILTLFNYSWHLRQVQISHQIRRRRDVPVPDMEERPPPPTQFFNELEFGAPPKRLTHIEETQPPERGGLEHDTAVSYGVWNAITSSLRAATTVFRSIH